MSNEKITKPNSNIKKGGKINEVSNPKIKNLKNIN